MNLLMPLLFQCFVNHPVTDQYMGSCRFQREDTQELGIVSVYQNANVTGDDRIMGFEFYNDTCERLQIQNESEIKFIRSYIWPWSEITVQYLKYRNGKRGNGMFMYDRENGYGHLRRFSKIDAQEKFFYIDVQDCQINLKDADFSKP